MLTTVRMFAQGIGCSGIAKLVKTELVVRFSARLKDAALVGMKPEKILALDSKQEVSNK